MLLTFNTGTVYAQAMASAGDRRLLGRKFGKALFAPPLWIPAFAGMTYFCKDLE